MTSHNILSDGNFEGSTAGQKAGLAAPAAKPGRRLGMLALLGALSAFGPLSMDMYLPSTPTIAANLHASQTLVQLTLSGCLAGLAVGQLVAGPLSDGLGRKRPLLAGVAAFAALSVACAAAPDIGALIAFRFLQGMAGATGVVLSLAIVRDLYAGSELARVLGSLMLVFGLAPVLAPVIGGQVLRFTSWRGVFGVLAAIGLVLLAASWFLPETLPPERRTRSRLRRLATDSRTLTRDRQYTGNAVAVALGNAALITYISALPFIVEDAYHQSPQLFSLFFTINAIGLTSMSQLGARLVRRLPVTRVVRISLLAMARRRRRLPRGRPDRAPAAGGAARAALRLRRLLRHDAPQRDRGRARQPGRDRRHRVGLARRAAVPARRAALPAGRPRRPGRGDRRGHPDRHPLPRRPGQPARHHQEEPTGESSYAVGRAAVLAAKTHWQDVTMSADQVDALVIFGATGDLAKLETFPALVGLVERGVLDVPVLGVAKSGWGVEQFRNYAASSLMLNKMDPTAPAAVKMLGLLKYVDGDLDDPQTYQCDEKRTGRREEDPLLP